MWGCDGGFSRAPKVPANHPDAGGKKKKERKKKSRDEFVRVKGK